MTGLLLDTLKEMGLAGLYTAMFLEGSSLPFPGVVIALTYGYWFPSSNIPWTAAGMSAVYALASMIPYFLGRKLGWWLERRWSRGLAKAGRLFLRYGYWSVAATRPIGLGNYISYVAGMAQMKVSSYLILTFAGIYPWACAMLLLGRAFQGNYEAVKSFFLSHSLPFSLAAGAAAAVPLCFLLPGCRQKLLVVLQPRKGEKNRGPRPGDVIIGLNTKPGVNFHENTGLR